MIHPAFDINDRPSAEKSARGTLVVALAGNPNCGKTTIFNALTGERQHVGNYPGVTVEKKEGLAFCQGHKLRIVDLPGTYSLTAYSIDEVVARNFLLQEKPDVVIAILDASNLERNLYLVTQMMEMEVPLVLAFNMADVAKAHGFAIDEAALSQLMGVPIVSTVGNKGLGLNRLLDTALEVAMDPASQAKRQRRPNYGRELEPHVKQLTQRLEETCGIRYRARWAAIKLLENDREEIRLLRKDYPENIEPVLEEAAQIRKHIEGVFGDSPEIILADRRYGLISGACTETVKHTVETRHQVSDQIDKVLTSRWLGLPIFALLMYLVFWVTFTLGEAPMEWLELGFNWLGQQISQFWPKGSDSLLKSLLVDGLIGGVGGVISFLPNIMLLFLSISVLEDSGYMARAAFIMDALMHKIGLHGKSFIPMLTGFGCSIPAIMATRILESRRDRLTTMFVVPLMSCGARLPIYALIIPAFFPMQWRAPVLWSIYLVGILLAVGLIKLLRVTIFKGETTPFIMELPPYRMPTVKGLLIHMWEQSRLYLRKAATVILAIAIVLWAMSTFPRKTAFDQDYSALQEQARTDFFNQLPLLNESLGLPGDSDLLVRAMQIEFIAEEARQNYWPDQMEYHQAEQEKHAALEALTSGTDGTRLAAFLDAVNAIEQSNQAFADTIEMHNYSEKSSKYAHALLHRAEVLAPLRERDPAAYAAATKYLEDLQGPFKEKLEILDRQKQAEELSYSMVGRIGKTIEPAIRPLGFDWKIGTGLIGAFAAKEVFVAQMGIVYSLGNVEGHADELRSQLQARYTPLVGYCIMLFCLISTPCVATIATTWQESGSWRWALLQLGGLTFLAYAVTLIVYQVGSVLTG